MATLNVVITEILLCLALAWVLGFLAAWILFRRVQKEYEEEIGELEENLSYLIASNKNQEKEIVHQNLKLKELETILDIDIEHTYKKDTPVKKENNETNDEDQEALRRIEDNLYSPTQNQRD